MSLLRRALQAVRPPRRVEPLPPAVLQLDGQELTVVFRRNARARRMILRLGRNPGEAVLTLPKRASWRRRCASPKARRSGSSSAWLAGRGRWR